MQQYIQRFGDLKRKLQAVGVLLPEDYVAQSLLERARLWPQEETAVLGACNQEYAWEPIVRQLVFMFPDISTPAPPRRRRADASIGRPRRQRQVEAEARCPGFPRRYGRTRPTVSATGLRR